ncbi:unnamed protein product [Staurois parvus]|uniref:Uncharacterized protein n=1 Tax=Staurois parvus TaxID=386267 RepID=A0ABN9AUR7_9NEOB|nr:unnamed protein product [Staurois parvus]
MSLVIFIGLFGCGLSGGRTQGPHEPLLPGGPMSCPSAPGVESGYFLPIGSL